MSLTPAQQETRLIHGDATRDRTAPEYTAWTNMRHRCTSPNWPRFAAYGGRGIRVCERWSSYAAFLADMGRRPSPKHSLDRIDNNGNYEPGNCRWATRSQQARNMRSNHFVVIDGESATLMEWAERSGLDVGCIKGRLKRGLSGLSLLDPASHIRQGEAVRSSKLTLAIVRLIRAMAAQGRRHADMAKEFGVAQPTISDVVSRRTWRLE